MSDLTKEMKDVSASDEGKKESDEQNQELLPVFYDEKAAMQIKKKRKAVMIGCFCFFAVFILAYLGTGIYFTKHFAFQTYIDDIEVTNMTVQEVEALIEDNMESYTLTLLERKDMEEIIEKDDIDMEITCLNSIGDVKAYQNPFLWIVHLFKEERYTLQYQVTYDNEKLIGVINNLEAFDYSKVTLPADAYCGYTESGFQIIPEVLGNELDKTATIQAIQDALYQYKDTLSLDDAACYKEPEVFQDNEILVKALEEYVTYNDVVITYEFGSKKEVVDGNIIATFLEQGDDGSVTVNKDEIIEYVAELAAAYDTLGTERRFRTSYGTTIQIMGKRYGYKINQEEEAEALYNLIVNKESDTREPVYAQEGYCRGEMNDIGNTYIEVNITKQHLFCYLNGELIIESDVVTGKPSTGNATPGGLYAITYTEKNAVLRGADYETPVSYWMPFNRGIGLHDATWQSSFGGTRYLTNGSHGCVNLPYNIAKQIYNNYGAGTPVICYYE